MLYFTGIWSFTGEKIVFSHCCKLQRELMQEEELRHQETHLFIISLVLQFMAAQEENVSLCKLL